MRYLEERAMAPYRSQGIYVNVAIFADSIHWLLGNPVDPFVDIFALGRIPGWTLRCVKQYRDNILMGLMLEYTSPMDLECFPFEQRDRPALILQAAH